MFSWLKPRFAPVTVKIFSLLILLLALSAFMPARVHISRPSHAAAGDADYISALATANRFLYAWQSHDHETGLLLLTSSAKKRSSEEQVDAFFSDTPQGTYEISRGKRLTFGRYAFPVALYEKSDSDPNHCHARHSLITVIKTGKDDWAIDTLP